MISFHQFLLNLKEALSLDDPLAQSTLKIKNKNKKNIIFEFKLNEDYYKIDIYNEPEIINIENTQISTLNLMKIYLELNGSFRLTNQSGMKANIIYNMLLNSIKQAHDHFGENNVHGYEFSGANYKQDIMYDKLMEKFAPNLITWSTYGIYLKPETIQKLKDDNPQMIDKINEKINLSTLDRQRSLQRKKEDKNLQRSLRRQL